MPKLGYDMTSGFVVSWLVSVGDEVTRGQAIAEIETDKATMEGQLLKNAWDVAANGVRTRVRGEAKRGRALPHPAAPDPAHEVMAGP
ncbi:MAG: biotin/lipoyl-binding protein, partial [Deltaproteobacteria bacterium]|nr:biotin/lipoyl-binding protein [Deltaproteobacteria bacterium]